MICEKAIELMSAELDGVLSEEERQALEAHLDRCEDCRRLRAAMASIDKQVAALEVPAPAELKQGVMEQIRRESGKRKAPKRRFFGLGTGVGIVAAMLVLLVGTGVIRLPALSQTGTKTSPGYVSSVDKEQVGEDETNNSWMGATSAFLENPRESLEGNSDGKREPSKSFVINPLAPNEPSPVETSAPEAVSDESLQPQPVTEELRAACGKLSRDTGAPVLLYSEFTLDSLLDVLSQNAPELADALSSAPVSEKDGLIRCQTDWQTALALQEWMLAVRPETGKDSASAASRLLEQMQQLDPNSESLYRVVTFRNKKPEPLAYGAWPSTWPALWAERLLQQENWALFLPFEDASPRAEDAAWLVFPGDR